MIASEDTCILAARFCRCPEPILEHCIFMGIEAVADLVEREAIMFSDAGRPCWVGAYGRVCLARKVKLR